MSKSGQPAQEGVDKGVAQCIQKSGVLGIIVKIMRANTKMGDDITIKDDLLLKAQKEQEAKLAKTRADYVIEEEEGVLSEEDKKLIDEVDEDEISEISVPSEIKDEKVE